MAWASGTCTDFIDFMRKLRDYAAGIVDPATDSEITAGVKVTDIQATGLLTYTATPANGDTVTIDSKTYTFQTTLTNVNGNVLIGGSIAAAAQNLALAMNLGAGSGTAYAAATTIHPTVAGGFGSTTTIATAKTGGVAGNSIVTTDTSAVASWGAATLIGGAVGTWTILTNGALMPGLPASGFATDGQMYLQGPGSNPADQIIIGFNTYRNVGNNVYGFNLRGATQFNGTLSFSTLPGVQPTPVNVALAAVSFNCWFWVNGRRIMAAARIGIVDVFFYAGFPVIFGARSQYPYPLMTSGSVQDTTYNYQQNNFGASTLPDPCPLGMYLRWIDGSWNLVQHYSNNSAQRGSARGSATPFSIWPQRDVTAGDGAESSLTDNEDQLFQSFTTNNTVQISSSEIGAFPLLPCIIHSSTQLVGMLDGVYVLPGVGLSPGDTVTVGPDTYDVFHNSWRGEMVDFFAIKRA